MQEALKKSIADEEQAKDVDVVSIYDHLSYSEYKVNYQCVYVDGAVYLHTLYIVMNAILFLCAVGKYQEGHTVFQRFTTEWYDHVLNCLLCMLCDYHFKGASS